MKLVDKPKTFLVLFKNGAIREFDLPDVSTYYRHNLQQTLNKEKFLAIENVLYACDFIVSVEDITDIITEDLK